MILWDLLSKSVSNDRVTCKDRCELNNSQKRVKKKAKNFNNNTVIL